MDGETLRFPALAFPPVLFLPNQPQTQTGNDSERHSHTRAHYAKTTGQKPRALVVDDVPDVTEMLAFLLSQAGYEVTTAFSAVAALAEARARHFDVVISDIGMPGMDGYDLAVALRALPQYEAVPLVALTGFAMFDDRERALRSGFNAHMTKPIEPRALLDLIEQLRN